MSDSRLVQIDAIRPQADGLTWQQRLSSLRSDLGRYTAVVVAYSGGVDSSLVLRVAHEMLGGRARGVRQRQAEGEQQRQRDEGLHADLLFMRVFVATRASDGS